MQITQSTLNKIFMGTVVTIIIVIFFFVRLAGSSNNSEPVQATQNNGETQEIQVTVAGGYSPRNIEAKANTKTILKMNSQNAFGCERAFRISKLGISKTLPTNGVTEIAIDPQPAGSKLKGSCSMGMYTFTINFV